eukprot:12424570-Karenia_brevis.AAC.1
MDIGAVQESENPPAHDTPQCQPCGSDMSNTDDQQQQALWQGGIDALGKGGGKGGKGINNPNYQGCWWCGMKNHLGADCKASEAKIQEYQAKKGKGKGTDKGKGKGTGQPYGNQLYWTPPYYGY